MGFLKGNVASFILSMYIGKSFITVVHMRSPRRNDRDISRIVLHGEVVKHKLSAAAGAVNQLPAFVRMTVHGEGYQIFADINYIIHPDPLFKIVS